MSRTREQINRLFEEHAFLPLFNEGDLELCREVIDACYAGGVRLFEFTNRAKDALDIFVSLSSYVREKYPDMVFGAGTIMDESDAMLFHRAGAEFLVSPVVGREVGAYAEKHNLFWCPGASTLTEIVECHRLGADIVKVFPAGLLGGPRFIEAIKGPCPWVRVMPTGGVEGTRESIHAWFKAGVVSVGMGTQLFTKEIIARKDFTTLEKRTAAIVALVKEAKSAK
jgi:2-dehydro-3-deoxyphosphogluconate aldolase/(4S)-4-hydroxy-2-oxoglutarate aldolase